MHVLNEKTYKVGEQKLTVRIGYGRRVLGTI